MDNSIYNNNDKNNDDDANSFNNRNTCVNNCNHENCDSKM